ncbi:MAG: hypothetical protein FWG36_10660 [Oscillospiraceae bacterium]|nr:hypothetical protein [Oscillospiraceae bacterium]
MTYIFIYTTFERFQIRDDLRSGMETRPYGKCDMVGRGFPDAPPDCRYTYITVGHGSPTV